MARTVGLRWHTDSDIGLSQTFKTIASGSGKADSCTLYDFKDLNFLKDET